MIGRGMSWKKLLPFFPLHFFGSKSTLMAAKWRFHMNCDSDRSLFTPSWKTCGQSDWYCVNDAWSLNAERWRGHLYQGTSRTQSYHMGYFGIKTTNMGLVSMRATNKIMNIAIIWSWVTLIFDFIVFFFSLKYVKCEICGALHKYISYIYPNHSVWPT